MITDNKTFTIDKIIFESGAQDVTLKGDIREGVLRYNSDLIISHTQLNSIINTLSKTNESFSINNYMTSEIMYDGQYLYEANLSGISQNTINFSDISQQEEFKQIRA